MRLRKGKHEGFTAEATLEMVAKTFPEPDVAQQEAPDCLGYFSLWRKRLSDHLDHQALGWGLGAQDKTLLNVFKAAEEEANKKEGWDKCQEKETSGEREGPLRTIPEPDHGWSSPDTMNHTVQTFFTPANTDRPPNYEMLKEEHEVDVLGAPHNPAPPASTVIHIRSKTSAFNTLFMNSCCLGFIGFTYSMKSRDRKMVGELTRAQADASTAKCLNVWALISGIIMTVLLIIVPILILQDYQ
ncbi:hypothetical protein P7K49_035768 [Saguinus oedipus]|uniref:Interferon-induced transmembrane protein 3 n=1 Tax=Saguinus oedipus TaxID=9490 RepID=A0ABQ9TNL9_SAGOE|nr:hypothetical protein P7K49_035768 [Saguinus oedipus]